MNLCSDATIQPQITLSPHSVLGQPSTNLPFALAVLKACHSANQLLKNKTFLLIARSVPFWAHKYRHIFNLQHLFIHFYLRGFSYFIK